MNRSTIDFRYIDDVQSRIEEGIVFETASKQQAANEGGRCQWLFRTGNKRVVIYQRMVITNGNEMEYQAFKNPEVSNNGTPLSPVNRNDNSDTETSVQVFEAPTTSANGTPIPSIYIPGEAGVGNRTVGQFNQEGFVRILAPRTTYMVHVVNNGDTISATVEWYLLWAELEEPA